MYDEVKYKVRYVWLWQRLMEHTPQYPGWDVPLGWTTYVYYILHAGILTERNTKGKRRRRRSSRNLESAQGKRPYITTCVWPINRLLHVLLALFQKNNSTWTYNDIWAQYIQHCQLPLFKYKYKYQSIRKCSVILILVIFLMRTTIKTLLIFSQSSNTQK